MAFNPRGMISRVRGMICRQQPICFTPCEYKIRQDLPYSMLFLLHGGKWRSDGCNLLPVPSAHSVLSAKLGIACYTAKFLKVVGGHCPVFAMPERPRKTTKSGEYAIYALFSVYAVPTFMSCKSRPTYLHTYGLTDGRTTGRIDHGVDGLRDGLPSHRMAIRSLLYILSCALSVCMENRAALDNTVNPEKPLCSA